MAHLPVPRSRDLSYQQHCCKICDYHWSNLYNRNGQWPDNCHQDNDTMITLIVKTRTTRTKSHTRRRVIANAITSRKWVTRPCIMTSPLHQAQTPCSEKGVALVQYLLLALVPALAQAAVAGATPTIMCLMMTASHADPSSAITCTPRTMMTDITIILTRAILFSSPSLLQRQRVTSMPPIREPSQQRNIHVSHLVSLFQIGC